MGDSGYMDAAAVPVPDAEVSEPASCEVDTLRDQLAEKLISTPGDWPGEERAHEWGLYMVDTLLPLIRDHVAAAVQAEREHLALQRTNESACAGEGLAYEAEATDDR